MSIRLSRLQFGLMGLVVLNTLWVLLSHFFGGQVPSAAGLVKYPMQINMAASLLVAALALLVSLISPKICRPVCGVAGGMLLVFCVFLAIHQFNSPIEVTAGHDPLRQAAPGFGSEGRLSVLGIMAVTSIACSLLGIAFGAVAVVQILAVVVFVEGFIGLFSIAYLQKASMSLHVFSRISLQSALSFIALGICLFFHEPYRGFSRILTGRSNMSASAKLSVAFLILAPLVMGVSFIMITRSGLINFEFAMSLFGGMFLLAALLGTLFLMHRLEYSDRMRHAATLRVAELNQELAAANEELAATNEELVATNEELQASNEEQLSINEQLGEMNQELIEKKKIIEDLLARTEQEHERKFQELFNSQPMPMWVYDVGTLKFLEVNPAAERKYGFSRQQFLQRTILDIRPEDERQRLENYLAEVDIPNETEGSIWMHQNSRGQLIHVEIYSHSLQFEGHNARLVIANDVSSRLETEKRFEDLTQSITDYLLEVDRQLNISFVNRAVEQVVNKGMSQVLGQPVMQVLPALAGHELIDVFLEVLKSRRAQNTMATIFDRSQNELRHFQVYVYPSKNGATVLARDISEQVEGENRIRLTEQRMVRLIENSYQITCMLDSGGRVLAANRRARQLLQLPDENYAGMGIWQALVFAQNEQLNADLRDWLRKAQLGQATSFDLHLGHDRKALWLQGHLKPLMETGGGDNLVFEAIDLTAIKETEVALRRSDARYRMLAENLPNGIIALLDKDWRFTFIEGSEFRQLNIDPLSLVGKPVINNVFLPNTPELSHHIAIYLRAAFRGTRSATEVQVADTYYQLWLVPLFDASHQVEQVMMVTQNINEIKRNQALVQAREQFIKSMMRTVPSFVYVFDLPSRKIVFANDQIASLLGYNLAEMSRLGASLTTTLVHPDDQQVVKSHFKEVLTSQGTNTWQLEARFLHKDGSYKWVAVSHAIFSRTADGKVEQIIGSANDISDLKEVQHDLLQAKITAENANLAKTNFLANMSHEIRNPINAMLGVGQLLAKNYQADPKIVTYVDLLQQSGKRLLNTIGDVLDMSKIESNRFKVNLVTLHLNQAMTEACRLHQALAEKKGLQFDCQVGSQPLYIRADENLLQQVFNNLIGNALKFTDYGSIAIHLHHLQTDNRKLAQITIKDTGLGMKQEFIERKIFQPFEQESQGYGRNYEGSGLGLFLSKKFTELMGGSISVQSMPGQGTTFTLLFPTL